MQGHDPAHASARDAGRSSVPPPALSPDHSPDPSQTGAQALAERVAAALHANDRASRGLGIEIVAVGPGTATLAMTVRDDMLNGHDIVHGGFVTALADSAFAYACNAYNELTVTSCFTVDLLAPGRAGDRLVARCRELSKGGRTGLYDVEVENQRGERIATFRGRSYTQRGRPVVVDGDAPAPRA